MKRSRFHAVLGTLYVVGFALSLFVAWSGRDYYTLPLIERPRADMHSELKPGGPWGHTLGYVGSFMLVTLLLYSVRKRRKFGLRHGKLSRWLDLHIWLGIMGPVFITLHSSLKFGGIVSVSYFSMIAVMLSGFVGRYIYIQIPRDEAGTALPLQEIETRIADLSAELVARHRIPEDAVRTIQGRVWKPRARTGMAALGETLFADLLRPVRVWRLRRFVARTVPGLPAPVVKDVVRLAERRGQLSRRRDLLRTTNSMLHWWHVIHKPFAYVMLIIMFVHIGVVVAMGEGWPFD